jgi:hypothetical protein
MKQKLRQVGPEDIRALIVNHQGWDPGDLDPSKIKPLDMAKFRESALGKVLRISPIGPRLLESEPGLKR